MVPSDRTLANFHRLAIVTMSPSAAVWLPFSIESVKLAYTVSLKRCEIRPVLLLVTNTGNGISPFRLDGNH